MDQELSLTDFVTRRGGAGGVPLQKFGGGVRHAS